MRSSSPIERFDWDQVLTRVFDADRLWNDVIEPELLEIEAALVDGSRLSERLNDLLWEALKEGLVKIAKGGKRR